MKIFKENKKLIGVGVVCYTLGFMLSKIDLCKFLPKTSSDLAAWLQAFSAILALFAVFWAATLPFKKEQENAANALRLLYVSTLESIFEIKIGLQKDRVAMILMSWACLEEHLVSSRSAKPEILPVTQLRVFKKLQMYVAQLNYYIKENEKSNLSNYKNELNNLISLLMQEMKGIAKSVFSEINGVKSENYDFDSHYASYMALHQEMAAKLDQAASA